MDDPILFWNAVTIECNRLDHSADRALRTQAGPTLSSRATAIAHIAVHDAYVLARAGLGTPVLKNDPYLRPNQQPVFSMRAGSDPVRYAAIAVAAAASVSLLHLYPNQGKLIDAEFSKFCQMWGADEAAHRFGSAVGQAIVSLRKNDGATESSAGSYMDSAAPGRHREDPLNAGQGFLGARYGFVRPFAVSSFHPLAKHPDLSSGPYLADLTEVAAKGVAQPAVGNTRSVDETAIGLYWAYDGVKELGTPPRLYNQILRHIAVAKALSSEQLARLFLLANVAMGDAGILAWFYKYHYDLWRPVVGIREHDAAMGPGATTGGNPIAAPCDPFWNPQGAPNTNNASSAQQVVHSFTPPFPAYPSGHATFGAAAFHAARLYLQSIGKATVNADGSDDLAFQFVSDELNGKSFDPDLNVRPRHMRSFAGLHQAIYENSISRIFLGVHWRFDGTTGQSAADMFANATADNIGGVPLGLAIANDIAAGNLKPTPSSVVAPPFDATP